MLETGSITTVKGPTWRDQNALSDRRHFPLLLASWSSSLEPESNRTLPGSVLLLRFASMKLLGPEVQPLKTLCSRSPVRCVFWLGRDHPLSAEPKGRAARICWQCWLVDSNDTYQFVTYFLRERESRYTSVRNVQLSSVSWLVLLSFYEKTFNHGPTRQTAFWLASAGWDLSCLIKTNVKE